MTRKLVALVLCASLALALAGCAGGSQTSSVPETTPGTAESTEVELSPGRSFSEVYLQYLTVYGALLDETERRLETHNAMLENRFPDSYYMNSNYLMLVYVPFGTAYPGLCSALSDDTVSAAQAALRTSFPDARLTMTSPGRYQAEYTYLDKTSGEEVERSGRCIWECDGKAESFRVRAYVDEELVEFTEFIPQGDDLYLIYTMTDLALIRYANGQITGLRHAHRISDPPLGRFAGDMRTYSLEEFDPFPSGTFSAEDFAREAESEDVQYTLVLDNDVMTYTGRIPQDLLNADGEKAGVSWQPIEPITLLK